MCQDITKSFDNKREPFSTKKKNMFNVLINILKFPPENLLTPCKDALD